MDVTGNKKNMHIGIASPCDINAFKNYLDIESVSKIVHHQNCAPAVNTLVLGLLEQGYFITIFTKFPIDELLYLKGDKLQIYVIPSCKTYPWKYLNGVWIDAITIKKVIAKHIDSLDVLHAHWTYEYAWAAGKFAKKLPVFCTIRDWSTYILSTVSLKDKISWLFKVFLNKIVFLNKEIKFIANSPYVAKRVEETYKLQIPIIPNPIKSAFVLKERIYYPDDFRIVTISQSNDKRKNIETLLYAFQKFLQNHPNSSLSLIGPPFVRDSKMFNHWDSLKLLKNVNLLGSIKHDDLIDILDDSSLLVHPSLEETFGNTLIEAMARRLPVLGGENSGAVPYVLNYGKAGFLCNVSDSDDILLKMECVFNDSKGRNELINNASDLIQNKYIDKKVIYLHVELYKKYIITGFRK